MALSLDKGIEGIARSSKETLNNIGNGIERMSWYTSCLLNNYQDVCQELKTEDKRAVNAIIQVYKRRDVILDMFLLYVTYVLKDKERTETKARSTTRFTSELLADFTAGRLTKKALAYSIAKTLAESSFVSFTVRKQIHKRGFYLLTASEYYGRVQKAAISARRLRVIDPAYYNILYK